jgi:hypothetical protein
MPVGALTPARNGEPERGERAPVVGSTEKAEIVLSALFATYKNAPVGSNASPNGCCPVGTAGGRCYGYRNVPAEGGGVKLVIHPEEAAIGERIFELSANGLSLKSVAAELNREKVPPPRPRTTSKPASWCPTAIREMLRRELYVGRVIWNRSRFTKVPGTNRRVARPRPSSEWRLSERPETENHQRRTLAAGLG